jgi:hypothetical protein
MSLLVLHKVLIVFAALFFFFFGIRELTRDGIQNNSLMAIICLVLGLGCDLYFVWGVRGGYAWKEKEDN